MGPQPVKTRAAFQAAASGSTRDEGGDGRGRAGRALFGRRFPGQRGAAGPNLVDRLVDRDPGIPFAAGRAGTLQNDSRTGLVATGEMRFGEGEQDLRRAGMAGGRAVQMVARDRRILARAR